MTPVARIASINGDALTLWQATDTLRIPLATMLRASPNSEGMQIRPGTMMVRDRDITRGVLWIQGNALGQIAALTADDFLFDQTTTMYQSKPWDLTPPPQQEVHYDEAVWADDNIARECVRRLIHREPPLTEVRLGCDAFSGVARKLAFQIMIDDDESFVLHTCTGPVRVRLSR